MNHFQPSIDIIGESLLLPSSGALTIPMTNDYLFRALLQRNNKVLKGLISALLHISPTDISSAVITNPIELGNHIDQKTFILDIKVSLNNAAILNLEMQVINEHNWIERSLSYLCRNFDQLKTGEEYQEARPVIQIGLLNFTLFPKLPEFFATYKFLNVKNHSLYSDKLQIRVLDLTHIDLATMEDKQYQLDQCGSALMRTQVVRNPPFHDGSLLTTYLGVTFQNQNMGGSYDACTKKSMYRGSRRNNLSAQPGRKNSVAMRSEGGLLPYPARMAEYAERERYSVR